MSDKSAAVNNILCGALRTILPGKRTIDSGLTTNSFRMEFGQGRELAWAICDRGREIPLG
jgi:hypothetical protein